MIWTDNPASHTSCSILCLLKSVSLALNARQIRCGYPERTRQVYHARHFPSANSLLFPPFADCPADRTVQCLVVLGVEMWWGRGFLNYQLVFFRISPTEKYLLLGTTNAPPDPGWLLSAGSGTLCEELPRWLKCSACCLLRTHLYKAIASWILQAQANYSRLIDPNQ